MKLKRGSTSVRRLIFIADSSSTTGAGLANLVYNSSGLVAYYFAGDLSNEVQITLATATLGTFASGGFIAVDNTNMPGWYEIGIPDAALDAGNEVAIQLRGATNMVPVNIYIELDAFDYQTATQPVNVTQFGGVAGTFASGRPEVKVDNIAANAITAASIATDAVGEIAGGVWDEATSGHTTAGTYGGRIVRATNSNVEVQITGSNHIAADVHEFQTGVITSGDFAAGAITSTVIAADAITSSQLAASAVTEIQSGLATTANQTVMIDGIGFMTSVLMGSISDAGTPGETTVISFAGSTYTVDYSGLDATGNRSTTTRTKT